MPSMWKFKSKGPELLLIHIPVKKKKKHTTAIKNCCVFPAQVLLRSKDSIIRWAVAQRQLPGFVLNCSGHLVDPRYLVMFEDILLITQVNLLFQSKIMCKTCMK